MRKLEFTDPKQFEYIYEAVIGKPEGYGLQNGRVAAKILDKMEAVGKLKETLPNKVKLYTVDTVNKPVVELEDAEYDLVKQTISTMQVGGANIRDALAVSDWLDKVPA